MMREGSSISSRDDDHTTGEEAEGKQIRANLQAKERDCVDITDEEFGVLGEYFMGQIV